MKKNSVILTAMLAAFCMTSCEDDLNPVDPQSVTVDVALATDRNVKLVLTGAYDALSSADLFGGDVLRNSELLAANGEILFSGTFGDALEIFAKETVTSNANVKDFWAGAYETINMANNVLSALDVVVEEDRNRVEGEALFIRGLAYFELVKFFAKPYLEGNPAENAGVPIVITPSRGLDARVKAPRESVAAVYARVIEDLERASALLEFNANNATRATKASVFGILSRVYLQKGDFAKARDAAHAVIASNKFALNSAFETGFNGAVTQEDVFTIPVSVADGTNRMQLFYAATFYGGRGDIRILPKHINLYEAGDKRLALFYEDPANGFTRTGKWTNQFGSIKVIRLAEMYLTRAETNLRLGTSIGAEPLSDVNLIRERAGLDPLEVVTLAATLQERRLELAHEGQRLHDVKRLQETIQEGDRNFPYNDNLLVFPIPQREINLNENLTQNAGYF
jgi:starch-binding outer membrane protein, SusD/RagB family